MARKNYDDYGYDSDYKVGKDELTKKAIVIAMILVAIILVIYLVRGCVKRRNSSTPETPIPVNPEPTPTPTPEPEPTPDPVIEPDPEPEPAIEPEEPVDENFNYEVALLDGGKRHYDSNRSELPNMPGECSVVELKTLLNENILSNNNFNSCNQESTYVKVCVLSNGIKQYTPWLTCSDKRSGDVYEQLRVGSMADIRENETYVEFKFLPQEIKTTTGTTLGKVEEIWKDDIKYNSYKTLSSTKYYRYRDKLFSWELITKNYYTRNGIKTSASEVTEYYKSSPNASYTLSSNKTTAAYKWYKSSSRREYYMVNGSKKLSTTPVGEYTIKDPNGQDVTRYRTRTVTGTYSPEKYYVCLSSSSSSVVKYQSSPCGQGINPEFNYQKAIIYTCEENLKYLDSSPTVSANATCYRYSDWSALTTTACNTKNKNICEKYTVTYYYWYKNVNDVRTYYPSGASSASGEKVYYTSEPFKGAIRDDSTKTTAYKWYNEKVKLSSSYTALAPSGYTQVRRTSNYKWSDWSSWSTKNPVVSDGRVREIQNKTKIKLQEIKGQTSQNWMNVTNDYVTEEELIKAFQQKGYNVNSLEDIVNNGQIKYELQLFVRNKKGE